MPRWPTTTRRFASIQYASAHGWHGDLWDKKASDKAIQDFSEAIRLKPTDGAAYIDRARAWENKGNLDKAAEDCNLAAA